MLHFHWTMGMYYGTIYVDLKSSLHLCPFFSRSWKYICLYQTMALNYICKKSTLIIILLISLGNWHSSYNSILMEIFEVIDYPLLTLQIDYAFLSFFFFLGQLATLITFSIFLRDNFRNLPWGFWQSQGPPLKFRKSLIPPLKLSR